MNAKNGANLLPLMALALVSCGNSAPTVKADTPAKRESAIAPKVSQSAPQADKWVGAYDLQPPSEEIAMGITALGGGRYKVAVSWGGQTSGGMYNVGGWEGIAVAQGDRLNIRIEGGSDVVECSLRYVAGLQVPYNMVGCGAGDGPYRKERAAKPVAAAPAGRWAVPDGAANKIGIKAEVDASEFSDLMLNCESGQMVVTALLGADSAPSPARLSVTVDGRAIAVPVAGVEDDFTGVWTLSGTIPKTHPLLAALPTAHALSMNAAGSAKPLPVAGLAASWKAFARACRL